MLRREKQGGDLRRCAPVSRRDAVDGRTLAINEKLLGPEHPRVADVLGHLQAMQQRYREAVSLIRRCDRDPAASCSTGGCRGLGEQRAGAEGGAAAIAGHASIAFDAAAAGLPARPLYGEAFKAGQLARVTAAAAMGRMAARFAAANDTLAKLVRRREDLVLHWRALEASQVSPTARLSSRSCRAIGPTTALSRHQFPRGPISTNLCSAAVALSLANLE